MAKIRKYRRRFNTRLIGKKDIYSPKQIADLFGVSRNTVLHWKKSGLHPIDRRHPLFFHGSDLFAFLTERQSARKRPLQDGEFYCLSCREARCARCETLKIDLTDNQKLVMRGACEVCGKRVNRNLSMKNPEKTIKAFAKMPKEFERLKEALAAFSICAIQQ